MELKRYRTLALEIFKTLNVLNSTYMQDLFYLRYSSARRPNNIAVVRTNTNTYGRKSLRSLGPRVWNSLPEHIKVETSHAHFRSLINTWFGKECLYNLCKHTRTLNSTNQQINQMLFRYGFLLLLGLVPFFFYGFNICYCNQ